MRRLRGCSAKTRCASSSASARDRDPHGRTGVLDAQDARVGGDLGERRRFAGEHRFDDLLVGLELVERAVDDQFAALEDRDAIGGPFDLTDLMRREQDGRAVGGGVDDEVEHVALVDRIETARRLVEDQDARPNREREHQRERGLHPFRERPRALRRIEREEREQLAGSRIVVSP